MFLWEIKIFRIDLLEVHILTSVVVVGTQWGDEGKGKITDFLAEKANVVVRYQGGDNAGHTIRFQGKKYKLHLVPSGIFYREKRCVIGNGVVINPKSLVKELEYLHEQQIQTDNLRISNRAHLIMPYHLLLDELEEKSKGNLKIGTTKKGIGPAYVDKVARTGIRIVDLLDKDTFVEKLSYQLTIKNLLFEKIYGVKGFSLEEIVDEYYNYGQQIKQYVCDTSKLLNEEIDRGSNILFEGAQGVMLDIDHGTYPFVTSSNPIAGGVTVGTGVGPTKIHQIIGVAKAYTTRVGDGPFPTELTNEIGDYIREAGNEYGTTTGRPRRVGWFDSVVVKHAKRVSGITDLSLNSIDVLTGIETLKICVAYRYRGEMIDEFPASLKELAECEPVYEELPGWTEDITNCQSLEELPLNARKYIERISELTEIPITIFSVGPDRSQTNIIGKIY